ncbi:MAG TPA: hypothetical protein VI759_03950 [Dehalococcoidia bacterium]|nr:hypothetical protein [Dehalococcoidia bacterium]
MKKAIAALKNLTAVEKVFFAFLVFTQVHYFYRYPFKIGSILSSTGYHATADYLQYPKYAVAAVVIVVMLAMLWFSQRDQVRRAIGRMRTQPFWLLLAAFVLYVGLSSLKFSPANADSTETFSLNVVFKFLFVIPFAYIVPLLWSERRPGEFIKLFLLVSIVYHVVYEALTILIFAATGRLPGLTFSNHVPRFGGGWDDPNGFGAFALIVLIALLLLPAPSDLKRRRWFFAAIALTTLFIALTFSVTVAMGFACVLGLLFLARRVDPKVVLAIGGVGAGLFVVLLVSGDVDLIYNAKVGSGRGHLSVDRGPSIAAIATSVAAVAATETAEAQATQSAAPTRQATRPTPGPTTRALLTATAVAAAQGSTTPTPTPTAVPEPSQESSISAIILGSSDQARQHENLYIQLYRNFGLVGVVLFLTIEAMTLRRAYVSWRASLGVDDLLANFFLFAGVYLASFALMNVSIAYFSVFPINLYAWIIIGLVWTLPVARLDSATPAPDERF